MTTAPLFSVVIPTYNQAGLLAKALDSVLSQTFQDYEIIVVDNYSTDRTCDVVRKIEDRRIHLIQFQNNGVIGAGRNRGILASRSSYIAFLDSDDVWYPAKLERIRQIFAEEPSADVVCHDEVQVRGNRVGRRLRYGTLQGSRSGLYEYLLFERNCLSTSATVVAKDLLLQVGLFSEDPAYISVEDYDLWIRLAKAGARFHFLSELLGEFRLHEGSESSKTERHVEATLRLLRHHFDSGGGGDVVFPAWAVQRRLAALYCSAGWTHFGSGQFVKGMSACGKALQFSPLYWKTYVAMAMAVPRTACGLSSKRRSFGPVRHT